MSTELILFLYVNAVSYDIFSFLLTASVVVYAQEEMYFSQNPKDATVVSGKSITLPCEVTPSEGVTYYWELNGKFIVSFYNETIRILNRPLIK